MPTYEYRCADCGADLEVQQKFTDDPLTVCPTCQGSLHKVFSPVGVVFKGSGFYATDNRSSTDKGKASSEKKAAKPTATKDAPAAAKPATPSASSTPTAS